MATISFSEVGSFNGVIGGPQVLNNPTSLQFGPDGRLYVSEQNGAINAFTIEVQNGEYIATDHELLELANGEGVVQSIQNHNDDGSLDSVQARQVTGLVVTGTATNPVLYVSSSDPRISNNGDINLDTNSGVVTRLTWNGTSWEAVDIIRGLPRSEENHSVNGLTLSPDGNTLYLAVGGNTNNGAPDAFFSFTSEFALSGTVLEIDLTDIESRPILTDPNGGQNGTARQFIYDLPTLDDPTVPNDGVREDANGLDVAGPFGGNDGFNQAILPADAPLRIFADGLRNNFDLVLTASGNLFTVDNGSNSGLGGDPIFVNGEATDQVSPGGTGSPEPLFLLTDGGFFGHPNPTRSNQDLEFVVRDDNGNPDASLPINTVPDLSALVPDSVDIPDGFIIAPSQFTGDPGRLLESGIRVPAQSASSPSLTNLGSSSNGLVEFTADVFDGALQGALLVTQFNGNVTLLNVNEAGTALEPLIDPGTDGILGTTDDEVIDSDGVFPLISGQSQPLDVTIGPDGTIFVAEFGANNINVFAPAGAVQGFDTDLDNDGILNTNDPFTRDATNGGSAIVLPGQTLRFDFDADQDGNLVGPSGFGGGLTGAQINNSTDFEAFFQEPSPFPGQIVNLDNVGFTAAAGGGTTFIENASEGTPFGASNDGEFLFQTGVTIAPSVDTFTVTWSVFNPASAFTTPSQRIGGFIGTGDQSDFLAITAGPDPNGEIQVVLEENDVTVASTFLQANDLFAVSNNLQIFFELEIDPTAATAIPTVTYETEGGNTSTVSGGSISLAGTEVLDAILGSHTIQSQTTGLALGLLSTTNANGNQPGAAPFQAVFDEIAIAATGDVPNVLFRVNAGGPQLAAIDGGPDWLADTDFLIDPNGSGTASFPAVNPGPTVDSSSVPGAIFDTERFDFPGAANLEYAFAVPETGDYEVRLYLGNGFGGTGAPGQRIFDVALEGSVPSSLDDVDLSAQFGNQVGGVISNVVTVTDGTLNIAFLPGIENPLINGIEIIQLEGGNPPPPTNLVVSIVATQDASEPDSDGQFAVSLSEATSSDTVIAYTVGGTATANADFTALSGTVVIPAGALSATIDVAVIDDQLDEPDESVTVTLDAIASGDAAVAIGTNDTATIAIADDDEATPLPQGNGEVILQVTPNNNNVQISNFGDNSFQVTNVGEIGIAQIDLDVTNALFPDTVFDPMGIAGDSASRPLTITTNGGTGVDAPSSASNIGVGGTAGFEGLRLTFDETVNGGFEPGEMLGFAIDMDPNSIAGSDPGPLTAGSDPTFDVGGVSGAEIIGSTFTVTFTDGTTATGQLQGDGSQGGSQALASQNSPNIPVSLTVNGLGAGGVGTYGAGGPSVVVSGPTGETARIVLVKGFIQPVTVDPFINGNPSQQAFAPTLQAQLDALAAEDFPANNAVEFQTVDVMLTGANQDISALFDFTGVANFDFAGEDTLPLGFVASAIDPANDNLPIGPVTEPIYLQFEEPAPAQIEVSILTLQDATEPDSNGQFAVSLSEATDTDTTIAYTVTGTAASGEDFTALPGTVTIPANSLSAAIEVLVLDDLEIEAEENVTLTLDAIIAGDADVQIGASNTATIAIADNDGVSASSVLHRVNAGGPQLAAIDGGPDWLADTDFLINPNGSGTASFPAVNPGPTVDSAVPGAIFDTERFDFPGAANLEYAFAVPESGDFEVRLYLGNGFGGTGAPGQRVFDVALEGSIPSSLDDVDLSAQFGNQIGGVISNVVTVTDGTLNIAFLPGIENPLINGIEIIQLADTPVPTVPELSIADVTTNEGDGTATFTVSLSEASDTDITVDFATADGTALAGSDYIGDPGTLTFAAGETSQTIAVAIADDVEVEGNETFTVDLSNATGATIASSTGTGTIVDDDVPAVPEGFLFTVVSDETLNGITFAEQDVILFDGTNFSPFFDGSDVGLPNSNAVEIVALDLIGPNEILLSFNEALTLPGLGAVDDSDVVLFTATSFGENTAGSFSLYLDGSDVGLSSGGEDIDGLARRADGSLLISTTGNLNASGTSAADEDVVLFNPASLGGNTSGSFSIFIDGSDIGLTSSSEDVDALSIDAAGDFFFSTTGNFSVAGVSGEDDDIFAFTPSSTGSSTSGNFASNLFFDASQAGLSSDIKGIDLISPDGSSGGGGTPIRLEAEAADGIVGNFDLESNGAASGGQVLSLRSGSGGVDFGFNGTSGTYDIIVGTFDETDGESQISVALNAVETGTTVDLGDLVLDANLGSALPDAQTFVSPMIASGVALTAGDTLVANISQDGTEFVRLDFIEFVPV